MPPQPGYPAGGGFMRGMLGGLAGGFLGSMLFRHFGYAGYGGMGGGGIGLLEILLIAGLGFMVFRMIMTRAVASNAPAGQSYSNDTPPQQAYYADEAATEDTVVDTIRRYDALFDARRFKEERLDDFFKVQGAWMHRDLTPVKPLLTSDVALNLETELGNLRASGRVNRLENIAVRDTQLVEAWQEMGKEYVTMWLKANLLDFTIDEQTGAVVAGDKDTPVKFEEYWTYVRDIGRPDAKWALSAIEQQ